MMNVYNGNVSTDADGNATVELPSYFEAINGDFRYQLTVIGQFAQAIVTEEVKDNHFSLRTDRPMYGSPGRLQVSDRTPGQTPTASRPSRQSRTTSGVVIWPPKSMANRQPRAFTTPRSHRPRNRG
jgi:hypothetical protein